MLFIRKTQTIAFPYILAPTDCIFIVFYSIEFIALKITVTAADNLIHNKTTFTHTWYFYMMFKVFMTCITQQRFGQQNSPRPMRSSSPEKPMRTKLISKKMIKYLSFVNYLVLWHRNTSQKILFWGSGVPQDPFNGTAHNSSNISGEVMKNSRNSTALCSRVQQAEQGVSLPVEKTFINKYEQTWRLTWNYHSVNNTKTDCL